METLLEFSFAHMFFLETKQLYKSPLRNAELRSELRNFPAFEAFLARGQPTADRGVHTHASQSLGVGDINNTKIWRNID